tara:strand:- start:420 stop:608 length:189 start_codon:yes stop_codon:yes gene_type:complete
MDNLDTFLNELEEVFTKHHGKDWHYTFDVNDGGVDFAGSVYNKKFMNIQHGKIYERIGKCIK